MVGAGRESPAPERVGRYGILLPIASGGMAAVYLARTLGAGGFEQQVALKLTHPHLLGANDFVADLVEEAKLAARIRHRNVISILDVGEDAVGVFLVMEYVEGDTLANLRRKMDREGDDIPRPVAGRILVDALAGLHAAHELADETGTPLGLVHRDVSPQNLLIGVDGVVRLADFGIAKATSRLGQTQSGLVKGKVPYMSPEQARGNVLDRRCDVWAIGVIAWELFAGRRLYEGLEDIAIILRLVNEAPRRLRDVVPGIHPAIDEAVARALTIDAAERTPTALAFSRELAAACRAAEGLAEADEVGEVVQRVFGAKLAERRRTVGSIIDLRAKQQALVAAATSRQPSSHDMRPLHTPESFSPAMPMPAMGIAPPSTPFAGAAAPMSGTSSGTTTGTTSISASMAIGPPRRPPLRRSALAAFVGVAVGVFLLGVVVVATHSLGAKSHAAASASATSSEIAATSAPDPPPPEPSPPANPSPPAESSPAAADLPAPSEPAPPEPPASASAFEVDAPPASAPPAPVPPPAPAPAAPAPAPASTGVATSPSPARPTAAPAPPRPAPATRPTTKAPTPALAPDPYRK